MQEDAHTLRVRFGSICESLVRLGTMGRLLDPTTCLPHENGGIPLSALPKKHNKQAFLLVFHTIPIALSAEKESCEYHFLKFFGMT